jgi:hypothetical protein
LHPSPLHLSIWRAVFPLSLCPSGCNWIRNTYCFSTATMVTRTRYYVTSHVHCLPCFPYVQQRVSVPTHGTKSTRQH